MKTRKGFDLQAYTNIAILMGEHYFIIDPVSRRIYKPPTNDGRVRLAIPLIKPIWRAEVAKITKNLPIIEVIASTEDTEDSEAAKVAQRIWDAESERLNFAELDQRNFTWVSSIGCSYMHPFWNAETNNVELEIVPHLEMVMDPAVRNSSLEARWCIHGKVLTKEQAFDRFGKEFRADSNSLPNIWMSMAALTNGGITPDKDQGILVLRMWHLPSRKYPKGAVITIIGDEIVEEIHEFPYAHSELPFIDFHHVRIPGRYEGQSMIRDLLSSQKDYDQARSRQAEARALLAAPMWSAPEGSVDVDRVSPVPGGFLLWRPIGPWKPEPLNPPSIPEFIFQTTSTAMQEMQDISGQHEVSRGQLPSAGMPASAVLALQEADDTKLGPIIQGRERGLARVSRQILSLVQQYWDEPRVVRTWSDDDNNFIAQRFRGAQISDQTDVRCVPGSGAPKSRQQIKADLFEAWDRRLISDPNKILKELGLPGYQTVQDLDIDTKHARRENMKMAGGDQAVPEIFHVHEVHVMEHNNWRKTEEFEELPDEVRGYVADHVAMHEALLQQQMLEQAEMGQLLGPEAGGPASEEPSSAEGEQGAL